MDDHRIEGPRKDLRGKLEPPRGPVPEDDPADVADGDAGYLDGELDELYYGIAGSEADPKTGQHGLDQLEGDDPDS
ncbi:MAG TPA: hypothetical protein VFP92_11925 [Rhodanobacteraceae bacterium]|nr:hypothetical protein [Rhodanobacteraceae bacterium]